MSTELEQKYSQHIHKSEIAFLNDTCQQRGVFATEDISYGDVILSADPPNLLMKYNIQLGQVTLDRTDNSKSWALWQKMFSMGDHNSIFEDMYEQATDNGMFTTPVSSGSARALFAALSLSQNKHNVCVNTHFSVIFQKKLF